MSLENTPIREPLRTLRAWVGFQPLVYNPRVRPEIPLQCEVLKTVGPFAHPDAAVVEGLLRLLLGVVRRDVGFEVARALRDVAAEMAGGRVRG